MIRGSILLWSVSPLELQVITSFLEAADYQVTGYPELASGSTSWPDTGFDAGVVITDRTDADLAEASALIRYAASNTALPIVLIGLDPHCHDSKCRELVRPIRLFELVQTLEEVIHGGRGEQALETEYR